jgi:hypothetical protein
VLARKTERPTSALDDKDAEPIPDADEDVDEKVELKPCIVKMDSKQVCFQTAAPCAA